MDNLKKKRTIFQVVGGVAAVFLAYFLYQHFMYVSTDDAYVQAHVVMLSPRVSGTIDKVLVEENQNVKKGDLLAQIDDHDYADALVQAESDVVSLQARAHEAELNYNRAVGLYKQHAMTQQQYDNAAATYTETSQRFKAARSRADQAKLNLSYTRIVAPEDGNIAKKSVEVGQFVGVGVPLIGFVASQERWVTANFKETELARIRPGKPAYVSVDAVSKSFDGQVESISSSTGATFSLLPPDNATGNFTKVVQRVPVRIKLDNLSKEDIAILQAGLSAVVDVRVH